MSEGLAETAKEYSETQDRIEEVEKEIAELRQQTFSDGSKDTEERARQLFSEVGDGNDESSKTEQLDELREEESKLKEKRAEIENKLLEELVSIRFPLDETIQGDQPPVEFPFSETIDLTVLDAISAALDEDVRNGEVKIQTDSIVVDTASIDDAIEAVERMVMQIRKRADANLNVPAQVQKVKDRDKKVSAILYVLKENDNEPMTKAEMEDEIGLERGDLRGQLYYVLENDPYLKKRDSGFTLTANGMKVIKRFVDRHGIPELIANKRDSNAAGEIDQQEEVTAYE